MSEPLVVKFEGSLSKYENEFRERAMTLTFLKIEGQPTDGEIANMQLRRFEVVMTEKRDW